MKSKTQIVSYFVLIITFFISFNNNSASYAQSVELEGYMGVKGGELFNYKLELEAISTDTWGGFAYTYEASKPNNAVMATVTVKRVPSENKFIIKEVELLSNNGFKSKATICLLQAEVFYTEKQDELKGKLVTRTDLHQSYCAGGTLTFIHADQIKRLLQEPREEKASLQTNTPSEKGNVKRIGSPRGIEAHAKLRSHFKDQEQREAFAAAREERKKQREAQAQPVQEEITEGKNIEIKIKNDTISFFIWDGGKIDYDKVNLYINNNKVLDNYTLEKKPKRVIIPISNEKTSIRIEAINEGNEPPNTADITIKDGEELHHILAYNNKNKYSEIILIKK